MMMLMSFSFFNRLFFPAYIGVVSSFNAGGKFQTCVKRKVKLSLSLHEQLVGREDEVIDQVFSRCFQDQAPFYSFQID